MGVFYASVIFLNLYRDFAQNFLLIIYSLKLIVWAIIIARCEPRRHLSWHDLNFTIILHVAMGAPTKRPKTKRPRPKTSQLQNVPLHKVPPIKRPNPRTSQLQNVPSPKTSQAPKRPSSRTTHPPNVPSHKTSKVSKRPNPKTSQLQKVPAIKRPKPQNIPAYCGKNCIYFTTVMMMGTYLIGG
jgi:hypothetical protein